MQNDSELKGQIIALNAAIALLTNILKTKIPNINAQLASEIRGICDDMRTDTPASESTTAALHKMAKMIDDRDPPKTPPARSAKILNFVRNSTT